MPPNKEQRERLKKLLELADNMDNESTDAGQGLGYFDVRERAIRHGGNLGKAYERGDVACHLHASLEARGSNLHVQNLCISLVRPLYIGSRLMNGDDLTTELPENLKRYPISVGEKQGWGYYPVLVMVGEVLQSGERIGCRGGWARTVCRKAGTRE